MLFEFLLLLNTFVCRSATAFVWESKAGLLDDSNTSCTWSKHNELLFLFKYNFLHRSLLSIKCESLRVSMSQQHRPKSYLCNSWENEILIICTFEPHSAVPLHTVDKKTCLGTPASVCIFSHAPLLCTFCEWQMFVHSKYTFIYFHHSVSTNFIKSISYLLSKWFRLGTPLAVVSTNIWGGRQYVQ